jgi:hypothetical protein
MHNEESTRPSGFPRSNPASPFKFLGSLSDELDPPMLHSKTAS